MNRRDLLRVGAASVAATALGVGGFVQWQRHERGLASDVIVGKWPELGNIPWLLPNLRRARMVVFDRPHRVEEARDFQQRKVAKRTRSFTVNTSAARLRGPAFDPAPAPGVKRILSIGDSVTFGWGVGDDESWPAHLERVLRARGHEVEVLNAGVPGQALPAMATYLQRVGPTLGLHGVCLNRRAPPGPLSNAAEQFAQTIRDGQRAMPGTRFHLFLPPVSTFDPHGMAVWASEAEAITRAMGAVPVTETTPAVHAAQAKLGLTLRAEGTRQEVVDTASGRVLLAATSSRPDDLSPEIYAFLDQNPTLNEGLLFDAGHPTAEGNAVLATITADALEAAGWFAG